MKDFQQSQTFCRLTFKFVYCTLLLLWPLLVIPSSEALVQKGLAPYIVQERCAEIKDFPQS